MSTHVGEAYHPINGSVEKIWEGFSWPCLFFGFLWYLHKGMWGWGLIALILAIFTVGISWLFFPFFANGQYAKFLLDQGYLNENQWKERNQAARATNDPGLQRNVADELSKLVALKEKGVLSEEEFQKQKRKLLS